MVWSGSRAWDSELWSMQRFVELAVLRIDGKDLALPIGAFSQMVRP